MPDTSPGSECNRIPVFYGLLIINFCPVLAGRLFVLWLTTRLLRQYDYFSSFYPEMIAAAGFQQCQHIRQVQAAG
jgi:hypothetical protein